MPLYNPPITIQPAIPDSGGTTGANTTAINSVLATLRTVKILTP